MTSPAIHRTPQQLKKRIAELKTHSEKFSLACSRHSSVGQDVEAADAHLDFLEQVTDGLEDYAFLLRHQLNPEEVDSTEPYHGYGENHSRHLAMSEAEKEQSWGLYQENLQQIQQAEQNINQQLDDLIAKQEKKPDYNGDTTIDKIIAEQASCNKLYAQPDTVMWESVSVSQAETLGLFDNLHVQLDSMEAPTIDNEMTADIQETPKLNEEQEF